MTMALIPNINLTEVVEFYLRTQWGELEPGEGNYLRWTSTNISYSFPTAPFDGTAGEITGFQMGGLTADQLAYGRLAFQLWDDLIALNLTEDPNESSQANITFAF